MPRLLSLGGSSCVPQFRSSAPVILPLNFERHNKVQSNFQCTLPLARLCTSAQHPNGVDSCNIHLVITLLFFFFFSEHFISLQISLPFGFVMIVIFLLFLLLLLLLFYYHLLLLVAIALGAPLRIRNLM